MKLVEYLATTLLLVAATAGAELSRPAGTASSAANAAQRDEIEEGSAVHFARISEELERRVEALIAKQLALHAAGAGPVARALPEPLQHFARTE